MPSNIYSHSPGTNNSSIVFFSCLSFGCISINSINVNSEIRKWTPNSKLKVPLTSKVTIYTGENCQSFVQKRVTDVNDVKIPALFNCENLKPVCSSCYQWWTLLFSMIHNEKLLWWTLTFNVTSNYSFKDMWWTVDTGVYITFFIMLSIGLPNNVFLYSTLY